MTPKWGQCKMYGFCLFLHVSFYTIISHSEICPLPKKQVRVTTIHTINNTLFYSIKWQQIPHMFKIQEGKSKTPKKKIVLMIIVSVLQKPTDRNLGIKFIRHPLLFKVTRTYLKIFHEKKFPRCNFIRNMCEL